jgi:hypothetical protein
MSLQLDKLAGAGYISVHQHIRKKPYTTCNITQKDLDAYENPVRGIQDYLDPD